MLTPTEIISRRYLKKYVDKRIADLLPKIKTLKRQQTRICTLVGKVYSTRKHYLKHRIKTESARKKWHKKINDFWYFKKVFKKSFCGSGKMPHFFGSRANTRLLRLTQAECNRLKRIIGPTRRRKK